MIEVLPLDVSISPRLKCVTGVYLQSSDLSDAQSVGQDSVHTIGFHLCPLQLEAIDSGLVLDLPESTVGVVVKLWRIGLP